MPDFRQLATDEMNNKTKPTGALGQLETLAIQLAGIQKTLNPVVYPAGILVFGGDHGVTKQGVSAYPAQVTAQMMANFSTGGAAINVIANCVDASIKVIDVGVNADLLILNDLAHEKIDFGTKDMTQTMAMTENECHKAMEVGAKYAAQANEQGIKTLALGEMGIGNTTAAAALICAITKFPSEKIVGRGTGIDDQALIHKREMVDKALALHKRQLNEPMNLLAALGGFEIAALCGAILNAASTGMIVVIDGFISTAGALVANAINPETRDNMIFAHCSAEGGHRFALDYLNATPLLNLGLRLGEGTGAALCIPIINTAAKLLGEMATFEQAGVSERS